MFYSLAKEAQSARPSPRARACCRWVGVGWPQAVSLAGCSFLILSCVPSCFLTCWCLILLHPSPPSAPLQLHNPTLQPHSLLVGWLCWSVACGWLAGCVVWLVVLAVLACIRALTGYTYVCSTKSAPSGSQIGTYRYLFIGPQRVLIDNISEVIHHRWGWVGIGWELVGWLVG